MRYLLDTCTFLWLASGDDKLSGTARDVIENDANEGIVSSISFWELSMKAVVGKLALPMPPVELAGVARQQGLTLLPLEIEHVQKFHTLPVVHPDVFDRLLAAISLCEQCTFVTPDVHVEKLGVDRLW